MQCSVMNAGLAMVADDRAARFAAMTDRQMLVHVRNSYEWADMDGPKSRGKRRVALLQQLRIEEVAASAEAAEWFRVSPN